MHLHHALAAGAGVQVVDILRHQQEFARPFAVQPRQRVMRFVRLDLRQLGAACIVPGQHGVGVTRESFGRCQVLGAEAGPQPVRVAKGRQAGFRADAGAGQDDDPQIGTRARAGVKTAARAHAGVQIRARSHATPQCGARAPAG